MILWITGQTESGKTTLAQKLARGSKNTIVLDGDEVRTIWTDLGLSIEDRREQNLRVARLAKLLESQGFTVIVAVIAPTEEIRREVETICGCKWIWMDYDKHLLDGTKPYVRPRFPEITIERR